MEYPKGIIEERDMEEKEEITFFQDQLINLREARHALEYRNGGNFYNVSYYLPKNLYSGGLNGISVSWRIVLDDWGEQVLVPKKEA